MKNLWISIVPLLLLGNYFIKKELNNNNKSPLCNYTREVKCAVVFHPRGCDYFICITADDDFILMEWHRGNDPRKGDILYGDFHSYGFKDGFNITQQKKLRVWVDDYMLSKEDAVEKFHEQCE